jgi:mRNA interferase YafQ
MLNIEYTARFKRDFKRIKKRGLDITKLKNTILQIEKQEALNTKLKDHELSGNWKGYRELHLAFDWLLIYKLDLTANKVTFVCMGTHSELFNK